ncbi:protease s8 tripeptidyl peptidase [Grosmannia clavigera kw1407]|uniref:Protease s8 tripeptidyl peptidase n=1 Tax=Grosmannia clavigera (strain kw1407 / UAMH 11150) TaxID=655863 RepID=F0XEU5_GROCL|nr:protease s8 tripeptidyl peptidase [Grosmannia clavigera kw1407]EFX03902.1 protease s8 tripeptidyl peptidase [Grosmannia clavigera kw1407]
MHWSSLLEALVVLVGVADVSARPQSVPVGHQVHERRQVRSLGQGRGQRLEADTILPMRIGLRQNAKAEAQAEAWLMDVSHPGSANYGKHWTTDEVIKAFQPTDVTVDSVMRWLVEESGIAKERITHSDNKAWLAFDATVAEAERLLHTEYEHDGMDEDDDSEVLVSCDKYHLPGHIQEHVDYVTPGVKGTVIDLQRLRRRTQPGQERKRVRRSTPKAYRTLDTFPEAAANVSTDDLTICDQVLTPACVRALYNFTAPAADATVSTNNSLGIFEEDDFYDQADLDVFFNKYSPQIPNGTHPILNSIDGGTAPLPGGVVNGPESMLDFVVAYPMIYPQNITLYQTDDYYYAAGGNDTTGLFNTFLDAIDGSYCTYSAYGETGNDPEIDPVYPDTAVTNYQQYKGQLMCGVYKPANVISISYGKREHDLPAAYQKRQCDEYLKLALQGVTILFASGDSGVGGSRGGNNGAGNFYGCLGDDDAIFNPSSSCSCPWVTGVGATEVPANRTVFDPEEAALVMRLTNFSSGGGFSNIFSTPSYQAEAVASYFKNSNTSYPYYFDGNWQNATGGIYNRNGRGMPDVSANGWRYPVTKFDYFYLSGGTSQSAPLFAALLNRIIDERIKAGKPGPLGFINPVLYSHPEVLNDITKGTNPGCNTWGFEASKGWDPVTGLGTPNYPKMLELFLGL